MKLKKRNFLLFAGVFLLSAGALFAEWKVQPADSKLSFTGYSRLHDADGEFKSWNFVGKINDNWTGNGKLVVRTESIDTQNGKRDTHLKSDDFFNVLKFPEATFAIEKVEQKGDRLLISGKLTLIGISKSLTLDLKKTVNGNRAELTGEHMINRADFGMDFTSTLNPIKDEVKLLFKIVLKKE